MLLILDAKLAINVFQTNISYRSIEKVEKLYTSSLFSYIAVDPCPMFPSNSSKIQRDQHVHEIENSSFIHIVFIEFKQGKPNQFEGEGWDKLSHHTFSVKKFFHRSPKISVFTWNVGLSVVDEIPPELKNIFHKSVMFDMSE